LKEADRILKEITEEIDNHILKTKKKDPNLFDVEETKVIEELPK
jgi:hypothetical protein